MNKTIQSSLPERVANLWVAHDKVLEIWSLLDSIRSHNKFRNRKNSPRNLFITGLSGTGKTQAVKEYAAMHPVYIEVDDEETEYDIKPVVYVGLPDPFTIHEFYQCIIRGLGAPILSTQSKIGQAKNRAFTLLEKQKTEILILDEMNHILVSRYVKKDEAMEAIKHVSNNCNVSIVCVGTPKTRELRELYKLNF